MNDELEEYRKKALDMLLRYNDNKIKIEILKSQIKEVSQRTDIENMAVNYDQPNGGVTNKVASPIEANLLHKERILERLYNELTRLEGEVERVDIALGNLPYAQRTLLKLKYVDKMMWKQVGQYLRYSEYYLQKELKESAIDMLTGYLFPELAQVNLFAENEKTPNIPQTIGKNPW